jgi:uncharacterized protein
MLLPITLMTAGVAALINLWLAIRCGQVRTSEKISLGDGGNQRMIARMRAQANFIEYAPIVLILIGLVELASPTSPVWLYVVAVVFLLGRIAHGLGMDGLKGGREIGITSTMLIMVGLALYALVLPYVAPRAPIATDVVEAG